MQNHLKLQIASFQKHEKRSFLKLILRISFILNRILHILSHILYKSKTIIFLFKTKISKYIR